MSLECWGSAANSEAKAREALALVGDEPFLEDLRDRADRLQADAQRAEHVQVEVLASRRPQRLDIQRIEVAQVRREELLD